MADQLHQALRVILGLSDQAYMGGTTSDRWIERMDQVFHYPETWQEYAEYARDLPPAFLALLPPAPTTGDTHDR